MLTPMHVGSTFAAMITFYQVRMHISAGDLPGARKLLDARIEQVTDWTAFHRLCFGRAEGGIRWSEGNLEQALCAYIDCPDVDFKFLTGATARLFEAILYARLGRMEKARIVWLRLAEGDGPGVRFDFARVAAKLFVGKITPEEFRKQVRREGVFLDNDAWFMVGLWHEFAGRKAEAKGAFVKAVECSLGDDWPRGFAARARKRVSD